MDENEVDIKMSVIEEIAETCKGIAGTIIDENKDLPSDELGKKILTNVLSQINYVQDHEIHQIYLTIVDLSASSVDPRMPNPGQVKLRRKERYMLPMLVTNKQLSVGHVLKIHPTLDRIGQRPFLITGIHQTLYDADRFPKIVEIVKEFIDDYDGYDKFKAYIKDVIKWDTEEEMMAKIQNRAAVEPILDTSAEESDPADEVASEPVSPKLVPKPDEE